MGFVNEFIPEEDVEKYQLAEIDKRFVVGGTNARDWTIDRERDIYLRNVAVGREDWRNQTEWTFYWHGTLLTMRLDLVGTGGKTGEPGWAHWKMIWMCGTDGLPMHLKPHKAQILDDLKEALTAFRGLGGVYAPAYSEYSVTLELDKECVL